MKGLEISPFGILMGFKFKRFRNSQLLTEHLLCSVRLSRHLLMFLRPMPLPRVLV